MAAMRCTLPKSTFTGKAVAARSAAPAQAKAAFVVTAKKAGEWLPGKASPAWLDGSLPGDYGFDPLNLGSNPENLAWYAQAEIQHCRWAMLGTAGILLPDLAAKAGVSWAGAGVPWYEAGKFAYFAPPAGLLAAQFLLMAWAEGRRWVDIRNPGSVNQDPVFADNSLPAGVVGYPGGIFDPFGYSKGDLETLKLKEVKNGRLAMISFLGYLAQNAVGQEGTPVDQWQAHLADPWTTTVWSNELARF